MLTRGWHSGAVFGTHAAAAATGVLLGLDAARFEDALGMAVTQSGGLMAAQYEAMCKRMHHGFAARAGYSAACLAAGGYTGIKQVFERGYVGFLSVFGEGHDPDAGHLVDGLGKHWETLRIAIKPYAAMGALHAPLDALFAIRERRPFAAAEVERMDVHLSDVAYHHGWWALERPITPIAAQMNVAYAPAVATLDGADGVRQFTPARIDSEDVWILIPHITAHYDAEFDRLGSAGRGRARLLVRFRDGSCEEETISMTRTIALPLDAEGVRRKFFDLTNGIAATDRQKAIADTVANLDQSTDVSGLIALLAPQVGALIEEPLA